MFDGSIALAAIQACIDEDTAADGPALAAHNHILP
jgi:hypothetical protein